MNRIVKIILILIVAFFLILGVIWLIGRNSAMKNGKEPLTFRQFLGLSTKKNPAETVPGDGTSVFNGNGANNGNGTNGTGTNGDGTGTNGNGTGGIGTDGTGNVNVSQFTDGGTVGPGGAGSNSSSGNGSINPDGSSNPSADPNDDGSISVDGGISDSGATQPVCSEEDMNIDFTAAEIAQLNILQNRFYALAQTLHSDTDVATELANHDAFTLKADNVLSLYAYCQSKLPIINTGSDAMLKRHVATPFWTSYGSNSAVPAYVNAKTNIATKIPAVDPAPEVYSFLDYSGVRPVSGGFGLPSWIGSNAGLPTGTSFIGALDLNNPQNVPLAGASGLGDVDGMTPVVEKILRLNLW